LIRSQERRPKAQGTQKDRQAKTAIQPRQPPTNPYRDLNPPLPRHSPSSAKLSDKLVLISPDGFASPGLEYGVTSKAPLMMRALPYVLPSFMLRDSLAPAFANADVITDALFSRYRDMMLAPGVRKAIVDRMNQMVLVDPVPLLKSIKAPILLVWGENDGMIPFANSADYLRALPNATLAALPGVGHIPQEEAPTTVAIVRKFLDR
jgi:pimeloyl-ACP methyl ester carboxylesterase